jgi:hypothetical protein
MYLDVTRLLQNPLGAVAEPGTRGDIVRISDGRATIYLLPYEYEQSDERTLRWLLVQEPTTAPVREGGSTAGRTPPASVLPSRARSPWRDVAC